MPKKTFTPVGRNVVCQLRESADSLGGIALPASAKFDEWVIEGVGDKCKMFTTEDVGATVILDKYNTQEFQVPGNDKRIVVDEKNIRVKVS
jgi:co-chaperonin GroES (HSP10)